MRILLQRVKQASVTIEEKIVGKIEKGLLLFVGFTENDTLEDIKYLVDKTTHLRIFNDEQGVMNESVLDQKGSILSVSQFTLYANTEKGRRPSYSEALRPEQATILYDQFNEELKQLGIDVQTGVFGADMEVSLINDGPVTILLESRKKHD